MSDLITITLVTGTGRHEPSEPVEAPTDDPHQVWAHVVKLADRARLGSNSSAYLAETGLPIYKLRNA